MTAKDAVRAREEAKKPKRPEPEPKKKARKEGAMYGEAVVDADGKTSGVLQYDDGKSRYEYVEDGE